MFLLSFQLKRREKSEIFNIYNFIFFRLQFRISEFFYVINLHLEGNVSLCCYNCFLVVLARRIFRRDCCTRRNDHKHMIRFWSKCISYFCLFRLRNKIFYSYYQMPHESTVDHEDYMSLSDEELETTQICPRSRSVSEAIIQSLPHDKACSTADETEEELTENELNKNSLIRGESLNLPHTRAETPRKLTHHHDEDDSDESSTGSEGVRNGSRANSPN